VSDQYCDCYTVPNIDLPDGDPRKLETFPVLKSECPLHCDDHELGALPNIEWEDC
jgi:hypothetical protein